ncbi:hypothetical protein EVAR_22260_1 [Eumeta japonica]|uniref:Uncharacterized protein n=1 Tax=Eumeta variegata TaxID=151549 RepID=A0A4C1UAJ5_EUMVA|nr:hypothetical protein EVAR_22260_1 [Eumeta japonica]
MSARDTDKLVLAGRVGDAHFENSRAMFTLTPLAVRLWFDKKGSLCSVERGSEAFLEITVERGLGSWPARALATNSDQYSNARGREKERMMIRDDDVVKRPPGGIKRRTISTEGQEDCATFYYEKR